MLALFYVGNLPFFFVYFAIEGNFQVQAPRGLIFWRGDLMEGFLHYEFEGHIFGGAYFRNFTVLQIYPCIIPQRTRYIIYTISLNNSQGLGEITIFFRAKRRQLLGGGDYFNCSLKVEP